jgi:nucleoside-diphosphate-sugar epimerase
MRVLVTGGGGFLGKSVSLALVARGDQVRVLGRRHYPELQAAGAEIRQADVSDARAVRDAAAGCDAVVHTAARVGSWGRYRDFHRTNVVGTQNVLAACRTHRISRLVFTSSPSVVHGAGDVEGIDESSPYATSFDAHYPRTKALAERLVLSANCDELATVALRPHLIIGPGDNQLLPRAVASARAGRFRIPGGPPKLIDWTYIDDAAQAHILALDRLVPGAACAGRAYFISQGAPMPIAELMTRTLAAAGVSTIPKTASPRTLYVAGCIAEVVFTLLRIRDREPPITRFVARQLSTAHWFDISAARRDLGYQPVMTVTEGLRRIGASLSAAR